jgi:hypothetical protein
MWEYGSLQRNSDDDGEHDDAIFFAIYTKYTRYIILAFNNSYDVAVEDCCLRVQVKRVADRIHLITCLPGQNGKIA